MSEQQEKEPPQEFFPVEDPNPVEEYGLNENPPPFIQEQDENPQQNLDQFFRDAHSVHSELYHSTVQIVPVGLQNPIATNEIKNVSSIKSKIESQPDNWTGEQLNEESHSCSDIPCLTFSLLLIFSTMITFIVILTKGTPNTLEVLDFNGDLCGSGSLGSYPYLYMYSEENSDIQGICAKKCPFTAYNTSYNTTTSLFYDISNDNTNNTKLDLYNSVGYGNPMLCLPLKIETMNIFIENLQYNGINLFINEIQNSLKFFGILIALSIIVSLILNIFYRILKKYMAYFLVFWAGTLLLITGIASILFSLVPDVNTDDTQRWALSHFNSELNYFSYYLYFGILILSYFFFFLLQTIFYWRNGKVEKLALLLKTAKDLNKYYKLLWLVGMVPFLLSIIFFGLFCLFYIYLVTLYSSPSFSFNLIIESPTSYSDYYILIGYLGIPIILLGSASLLAFSQFCFAVLSIARYLPAPNASVVDHRKRIFFNKLNYHMGSIFYAGLGHLLIFFTRCLLGIPIIIATVLQRFSPNIASLGFKCQNLYKNIQEKFSCTAFVIIGLKNSGFKEAAEIVSTLYSKNQEVYKVEREIGDLLGHLSGLIVFCLNIIMGIGFCYWEIDIKITFFPLIIYAGFGYFCGLMMTENYWFEINVVYVLFCVCEEVFGKREEKQYSYEGHFFHGKLNEMGGIYSIIKISRENEQFANSYNQFDNN